MINWVEKVKEAEQPSTNAKEAGELLMRPSNMPALSAGVACHAVRSSPHNVSKRPCSIADTNNIINGLKKDKKIQKRAPFPHTTYEMITDCDPDLAEWTSDGEMFVVKNPALFAKRVIPEYFDHSKFESFTRQLNFYGFNKVESKVIRIKDIDPGTINHVTFYNEYFKRGRRDLLGTIQRSTNRGKSQLNHIETLEAKLVQLSQELYRVHSRLAGMTKLEERIVALELRLGQDNHLETNLNLPTENETTGEPPNNPIIYLQPSKYSIHTLSNANTTNNKPSSDLIPHSDRQQSVRCVSSSSPDSSVVASRTLGHRILSPHTTHSNKEDSALHLLSEISNQQELNEDTIYQDSIQPNKDQDHNNIYQNGYSISHKKSLGTIQQNSVLFPQYGPSTGNFESNLIIGENYNNSDHKSVVVTRDIALYPLQSQISQLWQTLVNERSQT